MPTTVFRVIAVKDPIGDGYLGMAVAYRADGSTQTFHTADEFGYMETYPSIEEAIEAMSAIVKVWMNFRFKGKPPQEDHEDEDREDFEDESL